MIQHGVLTLHDTYMKRNMTNDSQQHRGRIDQITDTALVTYVNRKGCSLHLSKVRVHPRHALIASDLSMILRGLIKYELKVALFVE